jgi:hypothetical protein
VKSSSPNSWRIAASGPAAADASGPPSSGTAGSRPVAAS